MGARNSDARCSRHAMATLRNDGRLLSIKIQPYHLVLCCKALGGQKNLMFSSHQPAFPKEASPPASPGWSCVSERFFTLLT